LKKLYFVFMFILLQMVSVNISVAKELEKNSGFIGFCPDGGWEEMTSLTFKEFIDKNEKQFVNYEFKQTPKENLFAVQSFDNGINSDKITVILLPGATLIKGMPKEASKMPIYDFYEYVGLKSQFVLFLLNKAFVKVPNNFQEKQEVEIEDKGESYKLNFYSGIMEWKPKWKANVILFNNSVDNSRETIPFKITITIPEAEQDENLVYEGIWLKKEIKQILPNSESLDQWQIKLDNEVTENQEMIIPKTYGELLEKGNEKLLEKQKEGKKKMKSVVLNCD